MFNVDVDSLFVLSFSLFKIVGLHYDTMLDVGRWTSKLVPVFKGVYTQSLRVLTSMFIVHSFVSSFNVHSLT
jgi:hypothetical protein